MLRALSDVSGAVNHHISDLCANSGESRLQASARLYPVLRAHYPHLASGWALVVANETTATLNSWDRILRRYKRTDPRKWERCRKELPRRTRLKASLHPTLYRLKGTVLDITVHRDRHVRYDLSPVRNPLFQKYGEASGWEFGLTVTDRALIFNFRTPETQKLCRHSAGVDVNMPSADYATSDRILGTVDLKPITRIQGATARKRVSVQRNIPTDLRHQHRVLRRVRGRERRRVDHRLHIAVNELLSQVGERNIVLEDLTKTTEECMRDTRGANPRRRLAVWTHGRFQRLVDYKAHTRVLRVNPRGTSSECPRCGGRLDHPEWRRSICGDCQGDWHRDMVAATSILSRGQLALRGHALAPSALNALLKAARWRPVTGPTGEPMKGDEATGPIDV
jgi:putative transposase